MFTAQVPDKDLEVRRVGLRVDPETGNMYTREQYAPEKAPAQVGLFKGSFNY